jgi:hypothetical protein
MDGTSGISPVSFDHVDTHKKWAGPAGFSKRDFPPPWIVQTQFAIVIMPLVVSTSGRLYADFICLLFLHAHRETSAMANELPEESDKLG